MGLLPPPLWPVLNAHRGAATRHGNMMVALALTQGVADDGCMLDGAEEGGLDVLCHREPAVAISDAPHVERHMLLLLWPCQQRAGGATRRCSFCFLILNDYVLVGVRKRTLDDVQGLHSQERASAKPWTPPWLPGPPYEGQMKASLGMYTATYILHCCCAGSILRGLLAKPHARNVGGANPYLQWRGYGLLMEQNLPEQLLS